MIRYSHAAEDIANFQSLDLDTQAEYISDYLYDWSELHDYILNNDALIKKVSERVLKDVFAFERLDAKIQNKVIFSSLDVIKGFTETRIIQIIGDVKDPETYAYLFRFLNVKDLLEIGTPLKIIGTMRELKGMDLFIEVYRDPKIFNKLMQKSKFGDDIEVYFYSGFDRMPIEYQAYILEDLKNRSEYEEQYQAMYKSAAKEAKKNLFDRMPEDFLGQIEYYNVTHDPKAKESFLANIKNNLVNDDIMLIILSMYPEYISLDEVSIFMNRITLGNLLGSNKVLVDILLKDSNLFLLVNRKIKETGIVPQYALDNVLKFCEQEYKSVILDTISKSFLLSNARDSDIKEYILGKLAIDKDFLKDAIDVDGPIYNRPFLYSEVIATFGPYFSDEAKVCYYGIDRFEEVFNLVSNDISLMKYLNTKCTIEWIKRLEGDSPVYHYFPLPELIEAYTAPTTDNIQKKERILQELYIRGEDDSIDIPYSTNISDLYLTLDENTRREFISKIHPNFLVEMYCIEENDELKDLIVQNLTAKCRRIKNVISNLNDYRLDRLSQDELARLLNDIPIDILIRLYISSPSKLLENLVLRGFNNNPYCVNFLSDIDELVYSLSTTSREVFSLKKEELLRPIKDKDSHLFELLSHNNSFSIFKFLEKYNKGFFDNELIYNTFITLLQKYPFITNTINYDILSEELINLNSHFLGKVVKYPDIQERILNIKSNKASSYPIFLNLLNQISEDEDRIFDDKMLLLLSYFEEHTISYDKELTVEELDNLLRYILLSSKVFKFSQESLAVNEIDPLKYAEQISDICDEKMAKANSEFDLKNAIFMKYFDITYEDAKVFLYTYDNNLDELDIDPSIIDFVNNIKMIATCKNINTLKKIYKTYSPRYSINDMFIILNELQKAFAKKMSDSLIKENKTSLKIPIGGSMVDVVDAGLDFKILTHSTNAYASMPMVDDDYYKSWNTGKNLRNHGICTALVTDTCLGLPPLRDEKYGVIFGFNHLSASSISNMGPYDLFSVNNGYRLDTNRISKFMTPDSIERITRHTHNEIVLERANPENNKSINIQPDFVIVTSEMTENQKNNALIAAKQMNNGEGIPILYVDIAKIVAHKKDVIIGLFEEFTKTKDINVFSTALSLYESVKCTLFNASKYDFITPEYIDDFITKYIEFIATLESSEKIAKLQELEDALNKEKAKFDLVVDSGNRHKTFDLNYTAHIANIYSNISIVNVDNDLDRLENYMANVTEQTNGLSAHDETHMVRVTMLAHKIAEIMGLDEKSIMIVIEAAKNHDKGRINDGKNVGHGLKSAEMYKQSSTLDEYTTNMICAIIEYHEPSDDDLTKEAIFDKYNIPIEDREGLELLCSIVKDADALDRVRFTNPKATLDPKKLRTKEGKLLIRYANDLLAKTIELAKEEDLNVTHKA